MNVKFKMPKFGRKLTGSSMAKELLLTILGTTISIVLTFGTAQYLEDRQAEQARRQTAMILIHDIDVSVATLNRMADEEDKQKSAIQYVIDHLDELETLPEDTVYRAITMLGTIFNSGNYFEDSKEKVFNSSQESWKNLNDVSFVDNMETFYESRHYLESLLNHSPHWKYPMSQEEFHNMDVIIDRNQQQPPLKVYAAVLKEKLKDPKINYYIDFSAYRVRTLRQLAQQWKRLSYRNKFIMDIDDEELAEYVRKSQKSGRAVSESDLIGQWEYEMSGKDMQYYHFVKPDSFSIRTRSYYENPFYSGYIIVTFIYGGKWNLMGDSLMLRYSAELVKVDVDRSGISYRAQIRDSVESFIGRYYQAEKLAEIARKQIQSGRKDKSLGISTNKAGDKIELVEGKSDDPGNQDVSYIYLKRSNKQR